jgi:hypothetical protein
MKLTKQKLIKLNACSKSIERFEKEKITDLFEIIKILKKEKRYDWANWILTRVMKYKQRVKYAVFAAEQLRRPRNV